MKRLTATRRIEFDYGHRLLNHEGKCAHVHGHRGVVEIAASAPALDRVGRVIDFACLKELVGGWIDNHFDHAFIVNKDDHVMVEFLRINNQQHFILDVEPTAENLATFIAHKAQAMLESKGIAVARVRFYETPNCWAEWVA